MTCIPHSFWQIESLMQENIFCTTHAPVSRIHKKLDNLYQCRDQMFDIHIVSFDSTWRRAVEGEGTHHLNEIYLSPSVNWSVFLSKAIVQMEHEGYIDDLIEGNQNAQVCLDEFRHGDSLIHGLRNSNVINHGMGAADSLGEHQPDIKKYRSILIR